ncbi:MAG: PIN domain-containing protein [Chloroflexi bacterium]|nr:PIN domain-containing protein [Chloroflexota bacterium]
MGTVVVDAGVIIAILDASDAHHEAARSALVELERGSQLVLPASAYSELMVHPQIGESSRSADADAFIDALPARIEPIGRSIALAAAVLRSRHGRRLRLPDALVVATAVVLDADLILTTDSRWPDTSVATRVVGPR